MRALRSARSERSAFTVGGKFRVQASSSFLLLLSSSSGKVLGAPPEGEGRGKREAVSWRRKVRMLV